MSLAVREAEARDVGAAHSIYSHHVLHGFGTFDETPPSLASFDQKWRDNSATGLPWLVAVEDDDVVGYAYASPFRPRTGYRYTVEDSVYVRDDLRGRGIGAALLSPLLERCEALGVRQVVAVIGDSQNADSIALHRRAGFAHAGTMTAVGFKLNRWVDIVFMQRELNGGNATPPPPYGAWRLPRS
jgi:L-amino acid N-acyltransferase YncA